MNIYKKTKNRGGDAEGGGGAEKTDKDFELQLFLAFDVF